MNDDCGTPDPLRRSALTLHALPEEERRWMLAALPQVHVDRLAPLLRELQGLGIPRDASILAEWSKGDQDTLPRWPRALDTRSAAALVQVLAREPRGVARKLLSLRAWEWAPTVLAEMGEASGAAMAKPDLRPHGAKFEAALLHALQKQAHAQPHRRAAPGSTTWQRIRTLIARTRSAE